MDFHAALVSAARIADATFVGSLIVFFAAKRKGEIEGSASFLLRLSCIALPIIGILAAFS